MGAYVLRRLLLLVPTLFGISVLAFGLGRLSGDPSEEVVRRVYGNPYPTSADVATVHRQLGLDRPLAAQYATWAVGATRGRFGVSYTTLDPVRTKFARGFPRTLELALPAAALGVLLGIPVGIIAAVHRNRPFDQVLRLASLAGASIPGFWLAILLVQVFAVRLRLLPASGRAGPESVLLPTLTLALPIAAGLARFTRSSMLETLGDDYVRTALAKGVRRQVVMERHVLRNSLVPLVTIFGGTVARLLAGAAIVETIFAWPGVGSLVVDAINAHDFPVIQAFVVYSGMLFLTVNLLVDLAYVAIDPRIRLTRAGAI